MEKRGGIAKRLKAAGLQRGQDYGWKWSVKDKGIALAESVGLTALIAVLFYDSVWGMLLFAAVLAYNLVRYKKKMIEGRRERMQLEFKEVLRSVAEGLSVGYSIENAFFASEETLKKLYGEQSILFRDIHYLNNKVKMGVPIEQQFMVLAEKYSLEEMMTFGELFLFCKRMGGDYTKNMRQLAGRIEESINMKGEIKSAIAEKELELNIMSVVPFAIIIYMRLTAGDFMSPLYRGMGGAVVMSGCLLLYLGSVSFGKHLIKKTLEV